jgi:hypothetical protein
MKDKKVMHVIEQFADKYKEFNIQELLRQIAENLGKSRCLQRFDHNSQMKKLARDSLNAHTIRTCTFGNEYSDRSMSSKENNKL